jgi:hypothetical protein
MAKGEGGAYFGLIKLQQRPYDLVDNIFHKLM